MFGFTSLTEELAKKGAEGPEELTRLLNDCFGPMIALIGAQGGEVAKFSGDAVTVVFPAVEEDLDIATRWARQAAEAMQGAMSEFAALETITLNASGTCYDPYLRITYPGMTALEENFPASEVFSTRTHMDLPS